MSKVFDPTPEQKEVIGATDSTLVVSAAAGAGKTAVLVARYLLLVGEGIEPDQILTITFTKKAAFEMKRRIVNELRVSGRVREAQVAETGPIQTIHSFCERLLRENALEAGLDPRFDIITDGESGQMLERAIRTTLSMPFDESPEAERLISFLAGQRSYVGGSSPYAKLEEAIRSVLGKLRGSGLELEDLEARYTTPEGLRTLFEGQMVSHLPLPVSEFLKNNPGSSLQEGLQAAYREWGERAPRWIAAKPDEAADAQALEHTAGLFQMAASVWAAYEREIEIEQKLDFTSLESRAVRLLQNSEATRARVQRQYKVVMIDEAQDINPTQYKLLEGMQIASRMIVGDPQQSIYGFRLADRELFLRQTERPDSRRLSQNKRSDPGILRFIDALFGRIWGEGYAPMTPPPSPVDLEVIELPFYQGVEIWRLQQPDHLQTAAWIRDLLDEHQPKLSETAILVRDARYAQEIHRALQDAGIPSRIAGGSERFYARLEIRDLANTLRALGAPYDDFALLATLRSPVVGLSLDSIALLAKQKPVVDTLESFEPTVTEDKPKIERFLSWFTPLRGFADRLSAWEVLSELFAVSDYLGALARRRNSHQLLANVRKLLMLAASEPELGPLEYAERIRDIQNLRHKEGDAPAEDEREELITIMTIHKAKGLEWPVVIVPQMHKPLGKRTNELEIDPRLRLAITKYGRRPSFYYQWLSEQRSSREVEEELRLLYVALTRAKKRLCVVAHPSAKQESLARRVADVVGLGKGAPAGFTLREPLAPAEDE